MSRHASDPNLNPPESLQGSWDPWIAAGFHEGCSLGQVGVGVVVAGFISASGNGMEPWDASFAQP